MERTKELELSPGDAVVERWIENGWPWIVALAGVWLGYFFGRRSKAKPSGERDLATGLPDSQTLRRAVQGQLALQRRYHTTFSLCLFSASGDLSSDEGSLEEAELCQAIAATLEHCSRETELVCRHGEQFAVLLPHTNLVGAVAFAERACDMMAARLQAAVHAGVTVVLDGDAFESLLKRADEALFLAQAAGPQQIFQHTGLEARRAESQSAAASSTQDHAASHSERLDPNHAAAESASLNPPIWSGSSAAETSLPAR
jgi:diguanylate cyclase (GGDEF)-like protein